MDETGSLPADLTFSSLPDPGERYALGNLLGSGVYSEVFEATDQQYGGKKIAIKIQTLTLDTEEDVRSEYHILRKLSSHPTLPDLYGVYLKKSSSPSQQDKLWFVMECCEGGPVTDFVRGLKEANRRMQEEHIAYILKMIIKVLVHLHDNHVIHRDVKGSNILLTKDGEVKLVDFGLSRLLGSTFDKRSTYLGSPCWMAPEVIDCGFREEGSTYDSRIDVWALGITAIELGDGEAPYQDMHPTRTLFQIVRNPPPRLNRPASWSQDYNDFIAECLTKNPEHRPHIMELLEHPFITGLPQNDFHLSTELKVLKEEFAGKGKLSRRTEVAVRNGCLKTGLSPTQEVMHLEDLATKDKLNEDIILIELHERLKQGHCHTFVGDVLLVLTSNEEQPPYNDKFHAKYKFKSRSDNAPHIFTVADQAYQDMLHHKEPQHILVAGETLSGKTTNMLHLLQHLLYLGQGLDQIGDNVNKATSIIHALGNAATLSNPNSTRHVLLLELTFTAAGKLSGSIFKLFQLEKWRVTYPDREQANFHIFYYFYDAMESSDRLKQYDLDSGRKYRYLRTEPLDSSSGNVFGVREDPKGNVEKFKELEKHLIRLGFQDNHLEVLWNLIAAILNLGEVQFNKEQEEQAELENAEAAAKVARLLKVDEQKFSWALINHCIIQEGTAVTLRHTKTEAEAARDALACECGFPVDHVYNNDNNVLKHTEDEENDCHNLQLCRSQFEDKTYDSALRVCGICSINQVLDQEEEEQEDMVTFLDALKGVEVARNSDSYSITLVDLFGFECFKKNGLEQLFINTLNEQLQCHYNQHIFVWEMQEQEAEEISAEMLYYYDNKPTVDELMAKPDGLFHLLDEASKSNHPSDFILGLLDRYRKSSKLQVLSDEYEFSIAHCTGKVLYDARDMAGKNQNFLSSEMVDTMCLSSDTVVKCLFTSQISRTGNLIMSAEACGVIANTNKERWGAALIAGNTCRNQKFLIESQGQFSQTRQKQTAVATYRTISLEILRGAGSSGTHFVRCIRTDLTKQPRGFHHELVRQQLRALAVLDTAQARQKGYSHRIPFTEFICRYKFLAFDFDEKVDITKDNSRLLLVRLKMEGWAVGKSKVFLKYYHVEYLARLYETQVKKVIKVQSMMRAFLAKRSIAANMLKLQKNSVDCITEKEGKNKHMKSKISPYLTEESASVIIQKRDTNVNAMEHMQKYYRRWRSKTIFQVLLMYRAARQQDLVYFSQQIHLYNQNAMGQLNKCSNISIPLNDVECGALASLILGNRQPTVWKLPIHLQQDFPYFDTAYLKNYVISGSDIQESWDTPLQKGNLLLQKMDNCSMKDKQVQTSFSPIPEEHDPQEEHFIHIPFCRDPKQVSAGKSLQEGSGTPNNQNAASEQTVCPPLCVLQYKSPRNFYHKKPEVYNPGKARRLGRQRQEPENHSTDLEDSIIHDTIPMCNHTNIIPPTLQQVDKTSGDIPNNITSQNTENSAELRRYSGCNMKESTSPVKKQLLSLENENGGHLTGSYKPGTWVRETDYSNNFITEMEMKGKQSCDSEETDKPPFNFQAMLRKTNINRASIRRATDSILETAVQQTLDQKHNKNYSVNEEYNLRSKSIIYDSLNTSEHAHLISGCSSSDSKNPLDENEHWNRNDPKSSRNGSEQQNTCSYIKSWNGVENSSDSIKFASVDSLNRNEDHIKASSQKAWDENKLCQSESTKSQNKYENHGRLDSNRHLLKNEQHSLKNEPNFRSSLNKCEDNSYRESRRQSEDETRTTRIELVPGLIIQGKVTEL